MHKLSPLKGLRVLDLSQGIAGPHCGALFAEYGARVIKVEPTHGDWMRPLGIGAENGSAGFIYYNRGKESLALDLKAEGAIDVILKLAEASDVVIENNRPGVSDRLGIGFEAIKARQPRVIYVSVSGLGQVGPDAAKPLSDTVAQAHSGLMMINRGRADVPAKIDTPIIDSITGLYAFQTATMALWGDPATREARQLDVSLVQASAAIQGLRVLEYGIGGGAPGKLNAPAGSYPTADGWLALTLVRESDWQGICRAMDRSDLADDPKFATFADRSDNIDELVEILDGITKTATTAEWTERLTAEGVLAKQINDYGQWLEHPQTVGSDAAPTIGVSPTQQGPVVRTPGLASHTALSPTIGQHSREILAEAGVAAQQIENWISQGAVVVSA